MKAHSTARTLAGAALSDRRFQTRTSVLGEARGPLCGMGTCFECRVVVDGELRRSCREPEFEARSADAPRVVVPIPRGTTRRPVREANADVLVVGGGPAGLAAAASAGAHGKRVILLDDNPDIGGQIWRRDADHADKRPRGLQHWLAACERANVDLQRGATVFDAPSARELWVEQASGPLRVSAERLILATGSRELFLPFPGWTLPGVVGAGGLQALTKGGFDVTGLRVAIAGSGPLLLAVAAHMRTRGAKVVLLAEQAPRSRLMTLASSLWRQPKKLAALAELETQLLGVPRWYGSWPVTAEGKGTLEAVTFMHQGRAERVTCDVFACGFGLVPETSLGAHLGCQLEQGALVVDAEQRTNVDGVYAAGECTGIGGAELSVLEGQIAGLSATAQTDRAKALYSARGRQLGFAERLRATFELRAELRNVISDDTVVCRCEDVTWGALRAQASPRQAKLQTRCGMGPCQGRVCGPALEFLRGWQSPRQNPPFFPTSLETLSSFASIEQSSPKPPPPPETEAP